MTTVNLYILYKDQAVVRGEWPITHLAFHRQIINTLSQPLLTIPHIRMGLRMLQSMEHLQSITHVLSKGTKCKDCVICSSHDHGSLRLLTLFFVAAATLIQHSVQQTAYIFIFIFIHCISLSVTSFPERILIVSK